MRAGLIAIAFLHVACGGDHATQPDAGTDAVMSQPCWMDTHTDAGSVMLGTGFDMFEPMPDTVTLEYGTQAAGYDLPVNTLISGLEPGDASNALAPGNPWTRFHVYFLTSNGACSATTACASSTNTCIDGQCLTPINLSHCGSRLGYVPSGSGYVLGHSLAMAFDNGLVQADLQGKMVIVTAEVVDVAGHYAVAEKTVTLDAPPSN